MSECSRCGITDEQVITDPDVGFTRHSTLDHCIKALGSELKELKEYVGRINRRNMSENPYTFVG